MIRMENSPFSSPESALLRFAHLLQPIRDVAANWAVDVAAELESYLVDIESAEAALSATDFTTAALLVQGSAGVYARKVEHLYSLAGDGLDLPPPKPVAGIGRDYVLPVVPIALLPPQPTEDAVRSLAAAYDAACRRYVAESAAAWERHAADPALASRVSEWAARVTPALEAEAAPLSGVVGGAPKVDVCRRFLAALQLAADGKIVLDVAAGVADPGVVRTRVGDAVVAAMDAGGDSSPGRRRG
ncbi:hypothetical protein I4F81_005291 [Pyropia yezoensis]|uniref:Uncharacterized protein n=1 Tax=Pyropia yezoensis TaxID=2788 RepID=A0ACC3BXR7_PYRYE|nr:hypothetical protein I4F81_005291 [Neopyropia yezoensis]